MHQTMQCTSKARDITLAVCHDIVASWRQPAGRQSVNGVLTPVMQMTLTLGDIERLCMK